MIPFSTLIIRTLIFLGIVFLIDLYVFKAVKTVTNDLIGSKKNIIKYAYWIINIGLIVTVLIFFFTFDRSKGGSIAFNWVFGLVILFLVPKLIVAIGLLVEDVGLILAAFFLWIKSLVGSKSADTVFWVSRKKFISQVTLAIASIPFLGILHGITIGKYRYKVHRVNLKFKDLPSEFDGFTITQLSDIHSGSFDSKEKVKKGIAIANAQKSDLFLFTGDLVNNKASEMDEWIEVFKELKAPMGKFSVLGNHDYGDYVEWPSAEAKHANLEQLKEVHKAIGFDLMLNRNVELKKGNASINLIGIENWGLPPFPQHGDLKKATETITNGEFNILMSHDPSHFDAQVKTFNKHIHLTLSGHTHGMQFGIDIPGIKWSPVKYKYPKWAGLYQHTADKYLYVNRGYGYLAFPGRVGIWPEITVITVHKA